MDYILCRIHLIVIGNDFWKIQHVLLVGFCFSVKFVWFCMLITSDGISYLGCTHFESLVMEVHKPYKEQPGQFYSYEQDKR